MTYDIVQTLEREPVDDLLAAPFGGHEAAVPQAGQVRADSRLSLAHLVHQFTDSALAVYQCPNDP
jgi:hypothetical protein